MKKLFRSVAVAVAAVTILFIARPAWSNEQAVGAIFPSSVASGGFSAVSSIWLLATTAGLAPFATTGAIVYFVVIKPKNEADQKKKEQTPAPTEEVADAGGGYVWMGEEEAEKWAELYLRDNSDQLRQDIARGYGPTLTEIAAILQLPVEHRPAFGALINANASELIPLANKDALTKKRAARFFERMSEILRQDAALAADLDALRAKLG